MLSDVIDHVPTDVFPAVITSVHQPHVPGGIEVVVARSITRGRNIRGHATGRAIAYEATLIDVIGLGDSAAGPVPVTVIPGITSVEMVGDILARNEGPYAVVTLVATAERLVPVPGVND